MENICAKDIMVPLDSYPHVPYWFSLRQVIAEMEKSQLEIDGRKSLARVALVFDEQYRLLGMVRRRDILLGLGPNAMQETFERTGETDPAIKRDMKKDRIDEQNLLDEINKRIERPVREVIAPIRVSLPDDTPLMEIIVALVTNNVSLVPVLQNGVVAGVIRSADVLHQIGKMVL